MSMSSSLPPLYRALEPLSRDAHAAMRLRQSDAAPFLVGCHAVPITVDEFVAVQRHMPIVFSVGNDPLPLALMGLGEGQNVFVDDDGRLKEPTFYLPAYVRRYPFLLARLDQGADDLSLCFDPSSDALGTFEDGAALFVEGEPSEVTRQVLAFNEMFERAGQRTQSVMQTLTDNDLLVPGEVTIHPAGANQPFVYRGFLKVDETKLSALRGTVLRKLEQEGVLSLIHAHLFSLSLMGDLFARAGSRASAG